MLTAEIPAAAVARHEGHPDSILGFALITLASATGFGHRYISTTGRMSSRDIISMMWRLPQEMARIRHTISCTLITHRGSSLQLKTDMRWSCESQSQRHCCEPSSILFPAGARTHGPRLTSLNCGGWVSTPIAVAPSPSGCFCFDAEKVDCYSTRLLTTSIHSNDR